MIVAVTGGRDYTDRKAVEWALDRVHADVGIHLLIVGDAKGADALAWEWAAGNRVKWSRSLAEWATEGKRAGPRRNTRMLRNNGEPPDLVIAFPGGKGTANIVEQAEKKGIRVLFYREFGGRRELVEKIAEDDGDLEWMTSTYEDREPSPWERIIKDDDSLWDNAEEGDF